MERIDHYLKLEKLGEGTYGVVYKSRDVNTGDIVALKRIRLESDEEGVPSTTIREIALLKELNHPNIVTLREVLNSDSKLTLVFEYCEYDLRKYIDMKHRKLEIPIIKRFLFQLLAGIAFCHSRHILHRDLKPQNLFITNSLVLKIGDFGLARAYGIPVRTFTHEVVTLWYRAPDVLMGNKRYLNPIDIWSCGCILAEMVIGRPLFPGTSDGDELIRIFKLLGTPTPATWPSIVDCPHYKPTFASYPPRSLATAVPGLDPLGLDLLQKMLIYDPTRRITAMDALSHPWFVDVPLSVKTSAMVGL